MHQTSPLWRTFAHITRRKTAAPRAVQVGDPVTKLCGLKQDLPPYPYGPATAFKQSDRGLYGGKILQFGHKISDYGNKHVRVFTPNIHKVRLWSETLGKQIPLRVASSVLKVITKEGGLDQYLIKDTPQRIKQLGLRGWNLRYQVLEKMHRQEVAAPKYTEKDGVKVYGEAEIGGEARDIKVGKTRLAKLCFNYELDGSLKEFMAKCRAMPLQEVVDLCLARGIDADAIAVSRA